MTNASLAWYRQINRTQWRAFIAAFLGWALDGFDFTILSFIVIDIQRSFTVDSALAGALGTVTMLMRLVGGVAAGNAADRWGRKGPMMLSILWFSLFAFLSGFSTSYAMLFGLRALFGIGMGGEWAAGMPLALEHWPAHLRGIASGILQSGFFWGFMMSALTFQYVYPFFSAYPDLGWRVMFWVAVIPALLVLWIRTGVEESPVWLARQKGIRSGEKDTKLPLTRVFHRDLIWITLQTSILMGAIIFSYHSLTFWYPTFLRQSGKLPFWFLVALNAGAIIGAPLCGRLAETGLGRRGAISLLSLVGLTMIPLYLSSNAALLLPGAFLMGIGGVGMSGAIPTYLMERFPTSVRSSATGFVYHIGAAIGAVTPTLIGALRDSGMALASAMAIFIAMAGILVIVMVWSGPETRGKQFAAAD